MTDKKPSDNLPELEKSFSKGSKIQVRVLGRDVIKLDDVVGQGHMRDEVERFIRLQKNPQLARYFGVNMPNLLFYGSPGTGKTMTAKAIAFELIDTALTIGISSQDIGTAYINESANNLSAVLDAFNQTICESKYYNRGIVFFDEFDSIAKPRGSIRGHSEDDKVLNLLNSYMDGDRTLEDVSYIASTNFYDGIDTAQKSRFGVHLEFKDLKGEDICRVIDSNLKLRERNVGHSLHRPLDYSAIIPELKGVLSGRDIASIVNHALDTKLEYLIKENKTVISEEFFLTTQDIVGALKNYYLEHKTKKVIGI